MWNRRRATALMVAFAATLLVAVSVVASQSRAATSRPLVSAVHGIEVAAEHRQGTFTGYTSGGLTGGWLAVVKHTPLVPNATITGGSFTLITSHTLFKRPLAGRFSGGKITNTNPGRHCSDQTFRVVGTLVHFGGNRRGRFAITLTHERHTILGACLTYFATATGTLTLRR
jgi:hypothetical protein